MKKLAVSICAAFFALSINASAACTGSNIQTYIGNTQITDAVKTALESLGTNSDLSSISSNGILSNLISSSCGSSANISNLLSQIQSGGNSDCSSILNNINCLVNGNCSTGTTCPDGNCGADTDCPNGSCDTDTGITPAPDTNTGTGTDTTPAPDTNAGTDTDTTPAPDTNVSTDTDADNNTSDNTNNSSFEYQVLELVNAERAKYGLSALTYNDSVAAVAKAHSRDMAANNYFSHTSLSNRSPFDRLQAAGISYRAAAENIAAGQQTPQEVMNSWMNSSGHRANILNANVTQMGVGIAYGGSYGIYWTQMFIG